MSYSLVRNFLFRLEAERAHDVTLSLLRRAEKLRLLKPFLPAPVASPVKLMGIEFPNRIGLAAGLDKNATCISGLSRLGFGFIEVGTVTPRPQAGNPKPRLFRLEDRYALINRMGFNNDGVDALAEQVRRSGFKGVLGINIGKNKDTPADQALDDYLICLDKVYELASYVTINISSPNTPGLRALQLGESLKTLLAGLKARQLVLEKRHGRYVPLVIKVAPDLVPEEVIMVARQLTEQGMDGLIATNTTLSRAGVEGHANGKETGGLSGAPLTQRADEILAAFREALPEGFPIIASGGVMTPQDAQRKLSSGADLVQIYTGLIYGGPALIHNCAKLASAI